jgi:hypothetical protein
MLSSAAEVSLRRPRKVIGSMQKGMRVKKFAGLNHATAGFGCVHEEENDVASWKADGPVAECPSTRRSRAISSLRLANRSSKRRGGAFLSSTSMRRIARILYGTYTSQRGLERSGGPESGSLLLYRIMVWDLIPMYHSYDGAQTQLFGNPFGTSATFNCLHLIWHIGDLCIS